MTPLFKHFTYFCPRYEAAVIYSPKPQTAPRHHCGATRHRHAYHRLLLRHNVSQLVHLSLPPLHSRWCHCPRSTTQAREQILAPDKTEKVSAEVKV